MNIESKIMQLARSSYWQSIYRSSKEHSEIQLFQNKTNFSGLQVLFLYWCKVFALLYDELSQYEWSNLTEDVINDDIRVAAFLHWRSKQINKKIKDYQRDNRTEQNKGKGQFKIWKGPTDKGESQNED